MIVAGMVLVTLATYFPDRIAELLRLTPAGEAGFVFLGFFCGGLCGGFGLLVAFAGMLRRETAGVPVRLAPVLIVMGILAVLLLLLYLVSPRAPQTPRLRPGETITI